MLWQAGNHTQQRFSLLGGLFMSGARFGDEQISKTHPVRWGS